MLSNTFAPNYDGAIGIPGEDISIWWKFNAGEELWNIILLEEKQEECHKKYC